MEWKGRDGKGKEKDGRRDGRKEKSGGESTPFLAKVLTMGLSCMQ